MKSQFKNLGWFWSSQGAGWTTGSAKGRQIGFLRRAQTWSDQPGRLCAGCNVTCSETLWHPSVCKSIFDALKSQELPVGKNTLHDYFAYLEDASLVRTVSLHTASERQRMVNPRKAYPIDPGLISLYERTDRANLGHALETVVFLELERRGKSNSMHCCSTGFLFLVATKKPAKCELGLRQRLGRYAENKKTHLPGFINSHFANLQHRMEMKTSRLDPSFPVVNCSLQT